MLIVIEVVNGQQTMSAVMVSGVDEGGHNSVIRREGERKMQGQAFA